jgi:hypothetical protein
MGTYMRALVRVLFLLFWFLRKMVLRACVLIVETLSTLQFAIAFLYLG